MVSTTLVLLPLLFLLLAPVLLGERFTGFRGELLGEVINGARGSDWSMADVFFGIMFMLLC